jgi:hypothetical protein
MYLCLVQVIQAKRLCRPHPDMQIPASTSFSSPPVYSRSFSKTKSLNYSIDVALLLQLFEFGNVVRSYGPVNGIIEQELVIIWLRPIFLP